MTRSRSAAAVVLALHVAYGVALAAAPARLTRSWLGGAVEEAPTQVPLRSLAAREALLHGLAIAAALRGAPLQAWLAASIAGDLADVAATFAGRRGLPSGAGPKTLAAAGGSAALTALVLAAQDD